MRDALADDFHAIDGVVCRTLDSDDPAEFRQQAAAADFTLVVAPESSGILLDRCRRVIEAGGMLLGPSPEAVELCGDKLALARHFQSRGVPHPETWPLGGEPRGRFPVVWKPRDGAGSQSTFLIRNDADRAAVERIDLPADLIAQAHVPGRAASAAVLIGPDEMRVLPPCLQSLSTDGRFQYLGGSLPIPAELAFRATRLAEAAVSGIAGLRGYVGVDLVLGEKSENDVVIEINPRLTTSYVGLRRYARGNLAAAMLRAVEGRAIGPLEWRTGRVAFSAEGQCEFTSEESC
jgi:predicted ATP-grasp superfamily ATP-dependent carboligase